MGPSVWLGLTGKFDAVSDLGRWIFGVMQRAGWSLGRAMEGAVWALLLVGQYGRDDARVGALN